MRTRTLVSTLLVTAMIATSLPAGSAWAKSPGWAVPRLSIASPSPYAITNRNVVNITGKTTGHAVRVIVNRKETRNSSVTSDGTFSARVALVSGWNTLHVIARRGDKERFVGRSILLDRKAPVVASAVSRRASFSTASSARVRRNIASYRISEPARLVVIVSSRRGKRVRVLYRSTVPRGRRVVQWNGRTRRGRFAASGVYKLTATARDRAGNVRTQTKTLRVVLRRDTRAQRICRTALRYRGVRYVWGGTSPRGFDCSGFVGYVYRVNRVRLPRTSRQMTRAGRRAPRGRLKPGDILLFNTSGGGVSHAGLYLGRGRFINASSGRGRVVVDSIRRGYYRSRLVMARRVVTN